MPRPVKAFNKRIPFFTSGANVIALMMPLPSEKTSFIAEWLNGHMYLRFWAPLTRGFTNGPSKWMPKRFVSGLSLMKFLLAFAVFKSIEGGDETVVARKPVTPCLDAFEDGKSSQKFHQG